MRRISDIEFFQFKMMYWKLVAKLPANLQEVCGNSDEFLFVNNFRFMEPIDLSDEGCKRLDMINGPHALTLLTAWAIRRLSGNDNEERSESSF